MSSEKALKRLLRPETVAVIGGDSAAKVIRQCRRIGFEGEIWAVNPRRQVLAGVPCVSTVGDLPGVPDAIRETLFYPLVTGRQDGTGLGLALAQELASRQGGLIEYDSRPGRTVFRLLFPIEIS